MSNTEINTTAQGTLPELQAKEGHGGWGATGKIGKDVESVPRPGELTEPATSAKGAPLMELEM